MRTSVAGAVVCCAGATSGFAKPRTFRRRSRMKPTREAMFWKQLGNGRVQCTICPNQCTVREGESTFCNSRINYDGKLQSLTYSRPCMLSIDSLAKNPLYHVDPGQDAIGIATAGCNLTCKYCQNWDISQTGPWKTRNMDVSPANLIAKVKKRNLRWITFSYTEPTAYFEYALDVARLAKNSGIHVAICTAGYINERPLRELMKYTDAFSVTLKGYDKDFYRDVCGCDLAVVWKSIKTIAQSDCWMEVVNLVVPGLNDETEGLRSIARSLAGLDKEIPLHFLRFSPAFKLKHLQPTPVKTLERAHKVAREEGLHHVYIDLSGHASSRTICSRCGVVLIERAGFKVISNRLRNGRCPKCHKSLPGVAV